MTTNNLSYFLPYNRLQHLLQGLIDAGYSCVGPQVRDGAIVYDVLQHMDQLPWGIQDDQTPGSYQLKKIDKHKAFAFANGPQAIKPILFKPQETVWKVVRNDEGKLIFQPYLAEEKPVAIIGARSCDLSAMSIQDKVFIESKHPEPRYKKRREQLFVVAVNCSYSSNNCFCVSAGTGPEVKNPYDLLMSEVDDGFVVNVGSERGQAIIAGLQLTKAKVAQCKKANQNVAQAAAMQTKRIPLDNQRGLRDLLFSNLNHPRWEEVAERCLSCGNCTSVCPTCFCHSEIEKPSLDGTSSEHQREWDSCFTAGHSYSSGKVIRDDTSKRYRQWLTHKVGSWFDQFDTSGCVGCGRCVSWCPVGIDLTEELASISGESNVRIPESE
ncbi:MULTISPECIES: 4Fe-4S dicluster domain-containing protein [Legionella]|uniref:Hydrogenase subunit n=1 Tax=Legionella steelei TaxID=947033 RepID=A0A0W0ZHQ7_9GAMM|nr:MULTISPECIES: 4Fe-4S dicluster domain-containing protein [Legionella]KTD68667.1 hydrogenase subunit [Legionella steelei]MBN9226699.1 4Fe-4S dicluster domain-containing protein [Legionella steelei]OJW06745.1 MAG: sulfite reductase subunit A [Legionella sp. 39-23]